jgi:hypothetical protein
MSQTRIKLKKFPGEDRPRMSSRALAEVLGVTHEELCEWIEEHRSELERFGPVIQTVIDDED